MMWWMSRGATCWEQRFKARVQIRWVTGDVAAWNLLVKYTVARLSHQMVMVKVCIVGVEVCGQCHQDLEDASCKFEVTDGEAAWP